MSAADEAVERVHAVKMRAMMHGIDLSELPGMAVLVTLEEATALLTLWPWYPSTLEVPYEPAVGDTGTLLGWPVVIVAALP